MAGCQMAAAQEVPQKMRFAKSLEQGAAAFGRVKMAARGQRGLQLFLGVRRGFPLFAQFAAQGLQRLMRAGVLGLRARDAE